MDFGPKYIDISNKIEYESLYKKAIKIKNKNEMISEEMRLLYVALTRAKEQLIITGIKKDKEKSFEQKQEILEGLKFEKDNNQNQIPKIILKKYKSFLDWIELIILNQRKTNKQNKMEIILNSYNMKQLDNILKLENKNIKIKSKEKILNKCKQIKTNKNIEEILNWEYKYKEGLNIETKTSVTNLTKEKFEQKLEFKKPVFLENKNNLNPITKSEIGTAIHIVMQKLNFHEEYNFDKINKLIKKLTFLNIINEKQAEKINVKKILKFTNSEIYKKIKTSKKVYKEKSFYTEVKIGGEKVLLQGIIDLYFIDQEDNIILLDYKTDKVNKNKEELIQKYKKQLNIYKKAIEDGYNKKIKEIYIYSTDLEKLISVK